MKISPTENHLYFRFNSKGVDLGQVIRTANRALNVDPKMDKAAKYFRVIDDYDIYAEGSKIFILDHHTTQGVVVGRASKGTLQIVIPALSSEADISYGFSLLQAMTHLYPGVSITKPDAISDFSERGMEEAIQHCRNNMRLYLTTDPKDFKGYWHYRIQGYSTITRITTEMLKKQYAKPGEDVDADALVGMAYYTFSQLQWMASFLPHAEMESMGPDFDDEFGKQFALTIINARQYVNVECCQIILRINNKHKVVSAKDLYEAALRNKHIQVFTEHQYAFSEMSANEWTDFCKCVPGTLYDAPKTFILRWNPAAGSMSRKKYNHCLQEYGEDWGICWAIHDWQQAKKGDNCYMLLECPDDENPGIIFKGLFRCDPYTDSDWRGSNKERHYVDVECWDMAEIDKEVWITPQQLEAAIPTFNWRKGHSGEVLTTEQADTLQLLWNKSQTKNK